LHGCDRSIAELIDVVDHLIDEDIARRNVTNDLVDLNVDATVGKFGHSACLHLGVHRLPLVRPIRPDGIVARDPSATTHVRPIDVRRHDDQQGFDVSGVEAVIDSTEEELVVHPSRLPATRSGCDAAPPPVTGERMADPNPAPGDGPSQTLALVATRIIRGDLAVSAPPSPA
jgi:hypothetical protein